MALRFRILPVTQFEQNCSLIWCDSTSEAALVDAGIARELWSLPDDMQFVPGHGPMSTIGHERRTNPFAADRRD